MMRSLSTRALGQPSETKLTFGARISSIVWGSGGVPLPGELTGGAANCKARAAGLHLPAGLPACTCRPDRQSVGSRIQPAGPTRMTLIINNHDVEQVLTMEMTLDALEKSYLALVTGEAVCRPRI